MKTLLYTLTAALLCTSAALADVARPVLQSSTTKALVDDLATGARKITISNTGTLQWVNGATMTGASYFRTAAGLGIGVNVQAYDADLTTWAGITPSANVQGFLGAADYAAMRTALGLTIGTNVQAYDADLTTWAGITPSANVQGFLGAADYAAMRTALGLTIGTNVQAYDADLTTWAGTTPGTGVATALTNAVNASGGVLTYGIIGTSGAAVPMLNAANTFSGDQTIGTFRIRDGYTYSGNVNQSGSAYVTNDAYGGSIRGSGYFQTDSNMQAQGGFQSKFNSGRLLFESGYGTIYAANGWLMVGNSTTAQRFDVCNTFTSSTNFEAFAIDWQAISNVCRVGAIAGSGGGTVRPVQYHTATSVFWSSGSGSPEGVVTAGIGSLYTRTDGGAGTTMYVKESGAGNTGWIAK